MGGGGVYEEQEAGTAPPGAVALPHAVVVKGKRSKRQRVHAPPQVTVVIAAAEAEAEAEWSSSAASATATVAAVAGEEDSSGMAASRWSEEEAASTGCVAVTEEEEDMALCLMLLARGEPFPAKGKAKEARFRSRRPADGASAAAAAGGGEFVYECKTCNRCFPSFQALGGHRTSHKKPRLLLPASPQSDDKTPKTAAPEPTTTAAARSPSLPPRPPTTPPQATVADATVLAISVAAPKQEPDAPLGAAVAAAAASSSSKHPRVHECSICGAEFASGQALGGHMRRHRPLLPASAVRPEAGDAPRAKEKSLLELDLNMPAPCEEAETTTSPPPFAFSEMSSAAAPLLFPAALVDCHY